MPETTAEKITRIETELAEARATRSQILKSQGYAKGDRQVTRVAFPAIIEEIKRLEGELAQAERGGIRVRRIVAL